MTPQKSQAEKAEPKKEYPIPVPEFLALVNNGKKRLSREKLYRLLKSGELPSYRFGRKILVDPTEIFQSMRQPFNRIIHDIEVQS